MGGIMAKKSILDEIIVQDKSEAANLEDEILNQLIDEINLIKDESIRSFVRSVLIKSDLFWSTPSSIMAGDNPPDEYILDEDARSSGNAIHTKRTTRIANELCKSYNVTEEEKDCVIAACLLHAVTKFFLDSSDNLMYNDMYPYSVGPYVVSCIEKDKESGNDAYSTTLFMTEESVQTILRLIRCHLGPWSPVPETMPITYLDYIVHISHRLASKIYDIIQDSELINEKWRVVES